MNQISNGLICNILPGIEYIHYFAIFIDVQSVDVDAIDSISTVYKIFEIMGSVWRKVQ